MEEEHSPSQSSIDSASLDLSYSRLSLNSSSSDTFQEEIIASGGIVEPYQYEPVESENHSSSHSPAYDGTQNDERLQNLDW